MYVAIIALILGVVSIAGYAVFNSFAPSFTSIGSDIERSISDKPLATNTTETRVHLANPKPRARITNPVTINGEAVGGWFGEGVFPVVLYDGNAQEIARGTAVAGGEWMTEDYVPFAVTLYFTKPATTIGTLKLYKDNPSGLPQNEASLDVEVRF